MILAPAKKTKNYWADVKSAQTTIEQAEPFTDQTSILYDYLFIYKFMKIYVSPNILQNYTYTIL